MTTCNDTPEDDASDPLDALLASRPVAVSPRFTDAVMCAVALEAETEDPAVDALVASRSVAPSADFTDRAMAAVGRARFASRVIRFTPFAAAAACLALVCALSLTAGRRGSPAEDERVAAVVAADSELANLVATTSSTEDMRARDLARFADLDAALISASLEYAYEI